MTHEYLLSVEKYFGGKQRFQVEAENREEALKLGAERAKMLFGRDNIIKGTLKVERKLKPSAGKES